MQGPLRSLSELRIAPGRPHPEQLQNYGPAHHPPAMSATPLTPVSPDSLPAAHARAYEPYSAPASSDYGPAFPDAPRHESPQRHAYALRQHSQSPSKPPLPPYAGTGLAPRYAASQPDLHGHAPAHAYQGHYAQSAAGPAGAAQPAQHVQSMPYPYSPPAADAPRGRPHWDARGPAMSMPRVPSAPLGLRVDVPEAPLRVGRARPSPASAPLPPVPASASVPVLPPAHAASPVPALPPVPPAAREQIAAQAHERADPPRGHARSGSAASSDVLSVYDHYDDAAVPTSPRAHAHPQSPTLPRSSGPLQSGFLSRSVSAAKSATPASPAPATVASAADTRELTIEQFESARKLALSQPHDPRAQLELAKKLWEAADVLANRYVDPLHPSTMEVDERVQARNREAWTSQAIKIVKPLALKTRNPDAMFLLGSVYSTGGHGLEKDYVKALEYYQRAAQLDHTDACYRIAVCEEFGAGTHRDFEKALSWYHKAATLGSVASMYKLGMLSLLGSGDHKRDFRSGMAWLQRAADHADAQNPHALHELGLLYEHSPLSTYQTSDPLPRNDAKALERFYVAAKLGYAHSQTRLGRAFEFGELGCSVDPNWSISWYTQAAKQRDSDAELALAGWYWTGSPGVLKKNETEAFLWAERAAGHGNPRALFTVGYFYECGVGVPRDATRARRWYTRAAEKKHVRAAERLREMVETPS